MGHPCDATWLLPHTCDFILVIFLIECAVLVLAVVCCCCGACIVSQKIQKDSKENADAVDTKHPNQEAQDATDPDAMENAVAVGEIFTCSV